MRKLFLIVLLLGCVSPLWATHQRAAEITYRWMGGNTYEFTLTCYTYSPSPAGLQRDSLAVLWGDGFADMIPRVVLEDLGNDYTLNIYRWQHTYAASGTYVISMEDPDRNYGVINVPNSVSVPMYVESELVINPFLGNNNSPQLLNAPVDQGCVGKPFYHTPGAYDPDGDSLSYRLIPCKGTGGEDIPGYLFPQSSSLFEIDPVTGLLQWENPVLQGEYNVAILIEEWRHGVKIGSVIRDMQILVSACDDHLPQISAVTDTCVLAGTSLELLITASDPDGDQVTLEASGGPLELTNDAAVLTPPTAMGLQPAMMFSWNTTCSHLRRQPYLVTVRAKDDAIPVALTSVHTISIRVIAPPVEQLAAEMIPQGASLTWNAYDFCPNMMGIRVYRKTGSSPYQPDYCETGVRPGYQRIADLDAHATSFIDNNGGAAFEQGVDYCYRVVALFPGDAESQPSEEVCVRRNNDLPLMTIVSNDSIDLVSGPMLVAWTEPLDIEPYYSAPYRYRLIRLLNGTTTTVYSGPGTSFRDEEVTLSEAEDLRYQVEMQDANQQVMGTSAAASAVALKGTGGNHTVSLTWVEAVPWIIDSTEVFRLEDSLFVKIAGTEAMGFVDSLVENEVTYRYYVRTFGHYTLEHVTRPLVNYSAIIEVKPTENETPEPEPDQPVYELPNAFTPNGDGVNDVFVPLRITPDLITKVSMHVFNRWGRIVYDTEDIFINWDGHAQGTKQPCAEGTYFYVCDVEMTTPEGPVSKHLQGVITLLR